MKNKFDINKLLRPNIRNIKPYSSARSEFTGKAEVFVDANENAFGTTANCNLSLNLNRYPDPLQKKLKENIFKIKKINPENIFLGNGSDEPIDLLFRAFCEPSKDSAIIFPPTYGMYKVAADINNIKIIEIPLDKEFQIDFHLAKKYFNDIKLKLIFVCSPNNPTGNLIKKKTIEKIINKFNCIVVLDEAYIDFSHENSFLPEINKYPNLVILQTFSKAWGMAGLRLGMAFASREIISIMNNIKAPYNINMLTQNVVSESLKNENKKISLVNKITEQKKNLIEQFSAMKFVKKVYHSDANFVLVKFSDSDKVFEFLKSKGIIVRNRSKEAGCENCLRITIGTATENRKLIQIMKKISK